MDNTILDDLKDNALSLKRIIFRWETNRITYNVILVFAIIAMSLLEHYLGDKGRGYWNAYWMEVVVALFIANVLYCAVYMAEVLSKFFTKAYLTNSQATLLFRLGLALSVGVVLVSGILSIIFYA